MHRISYLVCLSLLVFSVQAQKPKPLFGDDVTASNKAKQIEAEALEEIRKQAALGALNLLADAAKSYRDQALRARVQAKIADAMWEREPERSRGLFRRAWDAAEAVEGQGTPAATASGRISNRPRSQPNMVLRSEVLRLAAKRDKTLGEEFLAKLAPLPPSDGSRADHSPDTAAASLSPAARAQRLRLATEFLEAGDIERALLFGDPALGPVIRPAISFLLALREKNPAAADQRFASLLANAAADQSSDANTVSLLTTYAFTPSTMVIVSDAGIPSILMYEPRPAPELSASLRAAYFRVVSGILLRPAGALDQTAPGRAGTYYMGTRLFPLFQQHAPDLAPLLSAQLTALRGDARQAVNEEPNRNAGLTPEDSAANQKADLQDRIDRARTADERDRAYAFAAMRAADHGDMQAQDLAEKIEDSDTRKGVRRFVDYSLISGLLRKNDVVEALRLSAKSDLTPAHRTTILTSAAGVLAKTDRARALALLDEAVEEARRIKAATPERAYALVGLLAQFGKIDPTRVGSLADETVKTANAVSGFTGEDGQIQITLEGKFNIQMGVLLASSSDLTDIFGLLAADDPFHALSLAGDFAGEGPRALATIAAARAILTRKPIANKTN